MKFYKNIEEKELLEAYTKNNKVKNVNAHIHTPYSFSAFTNIEQPFKMAVDEKISILGINDFFTFGGYDEFYKHSVSYKIFPMFNVEFIGLNSDFQEKGIRVNDPNNPGRIYFSGKGISYPLTINKQNADFLNQLKDGANNQSCLMAGKLNEHLTKVNAGFSLNYNAILEDYVTELSRERHLAKALREKVFKLFLSEKDRLDKLKEIYDGKEPKANINDDAAVENEIRSNLLKSGGPAFVEEGKNAFPDIGKIISFIKDAGGIPCYPVLLDDKNGDMTDFEGNWEEMYNTLNSWNVNCIELIPGRNTLSCLLDFVTFFHEKGFVITFGTEHNTPELSPLTVNAKDQELTDNLKRISYEGACLTAAHQYKSFKEIKGYDFNEEINKDKESMLLLGKAVIEYFIKSS